MRKKYLFILSFCLFLFPMILFAQERSYTTLFSSERPILDGKLDEEFWKSIPEETDFIILGTEKIAKKQTFFKITYDQENLYIGIRCKEPDMDKIKAQFKDEKTVWMDDSVEIFLFPDDEKTYYQFVVNTEGYRFNQKDSLGNVPLWDWKARVYKGKDFYSVELKIPFVLLFSFPQKDKQVWKMNIARNILTVPKSEKHTCWPYLKGGFHEVENFAKIIFPKKISGEKIMAKLFPYYRKEISKNLGKISILRNSLKEKENLKEIKEYFKNCKELKNSFDRIHALSFSSFSRLKFLIIESENLIAEGAKLKDEVKKEFLLDTFFE